MKIGNYLLLATLFSASFSFAQPVMIKDVGIAPRGIITGAGDGSLFVASGDYVYFIPNGDDRFGSELWRTDGTEAGTIRLTDNPPGPSGSIARQPVVFGTGVMFATLNPTMQYGHGIWKSDGTVAGTTMLGTATFEGTPLRVMAIKSAGNKAYILAENSTAKQVCLGVTDGTVEGTKFITKFGYDADHRYTTVNPPVLETSGENAYIKIPEESISNHFVTTRLYYTDGTANGTVLLKADMFNDFRAVTIGDTFYFAEGKDLWKSNGTEAGTSVVTTISDMYISSLYQFGDKIVVVIPQRGIWISDGTPGGSVKIYDQYIFAYGVDGSKFYGVWRDGNASQTPVLMVSDGTPEGTTDVGNLADGEVGLGLLKIPVINHKVVVPYQTAEKGTEIGLFDGTNPITHIKDIYPGEKSSLSVYFTSYAVLDDKVYFIADDGVHGFELWITDGTEAGTKLVKDVVSINSSGINRGAQVFSISAGKFFAARTEPNGSSVFYKVTEQPLDAAMVSPDPATIQGSTKDKIILSGARDLKVFDGVNITTVQEFSPSATVGFTTPNYNNTVALGNKLIMVISVFDAGGFDAELWATDGTPEGSGFIKDINPGPAIGAFPGSAVPGTLFAKLSESLLLFAGTDSHGSELWKTDGTPEGTVMLKEMKTGSASGQPQGFTVIDGIAYFSGNDDTSGTELWRSDGTEAGTYRLKDLNPTGNSQPRWFVKYKDRIYFAALDETKGWCIWKTDGTEAGTTLAFDPAPTTSSTSGVPTYLTVSNDMLFLAATDTELGRELAVSDGTQEGTFMIDIVPGTGSSNPDLITDTGGGVYFSANKQLWRSNGDPERTQLVMGGDVLPDISYIAKYDGALYFDAVVETYGREFFKLIPEAFHKREQSITFEPTDHSLEDATFELNSAASSGMPVAFATSSDKITINEHTATVKKAGKATITATQAGNYKFDGASKEATICINPKKPVISFTTQVSGQFKGGVSETEGVQWFINGNPIEGSTGKSPSKTDVTGDYTVQITIEGCKSPMSEPYHYIFSGLEDEIPGLSVYPNPVKDVVYINSNSSGQVQIVSATGQIAERRDFTGNTQLSMSGYLKGIYFLKIAVDDRIVVRKIFKE